MKRRPLLALAATVLLAPLLVAPPAVAEPTPTNGLRQVDDLPTVALAPYADWFWHRPDHAFVHTTPNGDVGIATLLAEEGTQLQVSTYDPDSFAPTGASRTVTFPAGWTQWGGITQLADGSFIVLNGRKNLQETVGREVVAVRRYTADWTPGSVAYLTSGTFEANTDVYEPFDGVKPAMTVVGNRLVVHAARSRYESGDGDHHQTNLTFEVDLGTMAVTRFDAVGDAPFSSHSFAQHAAMNGSDLVLVDHGDFSPRALQVSVMRDYPRSRSISATSRMAIGGVEGENATGLSATGLVSGPQGVVVLGTSVRQDATPWRHEERRNLFALHVDPSTGEQQRTWLTSFGPTGSTSAGEPRVVEVGEDRFAVLSDVVSGSSHRTEYRLVDSSGAVLAQRSFDGTFFAGTSQPVLVGDRVLWVGKTASDQEYSAWLFALDVSDPTVPVFVTENRGFPTSPAPVVTGTPRVGATLTAAPGDWRTTTVPTFSYRWKVGGAVVPGATRRTFTPTASHLRRTVSVDVTASLRGYVTTTRSSRATAIVAAGRLTSATPSISGSTRVGSTLTARPGVWGPSGVKLSYRWYAGGKAIPGATSSRVRLTSKQRRLAVTVAVTGTKAGYTTVRKVSASTAKIR